MMKLPKVRKSIKSGLTRFESVRKVVLGVAMITSTVLAGGLVSEAGANILSMPEQAMEQQQGAMLLTPVIQVGNQLAYHTSHVSHASHASHASHVSHYSSR